jgi:hypothetical protein
VALLLAAGSSAFVGAARLAPPSKASNPRPRPLRFDDLFMDN